MSETESFESVASRYDDCTWIGRDGVKAAIDRLKAAHDREIHDTAQQQFARGFNAGQHSMDAEHRAVAMRLRGLRFDGGSHENLSRIAYAIYPCATGWTCESAAGLRDKLVDLLGGVSDDTCDSQCRGACAAGDCGRAGEQTEVSDGGTTHDCVDDSRGGSGSELVHLDGLVAYDVLDNERRKAIAELRKIHTDAGGFVKALAKALGVEWQAPRVHQTLTIVRDRLIHLLGGDQPSGIDVLCAMDAESDADGTCPNDDQILSITNELRRWALTEVPYHYGHQLQGIADRIDEQFDRICEQQEAVLQKTVDEMVKEYEHDRESDQLRVEKLENQRDHWHQQATDMMNHADAMEHKRDEAYARTDELNDELLRVRRERDEARNECDRLKRDMLDKWVPRTSYEEKVEKYRRAYMESDAWRKSLQEKLNAMRDAITAALNG